MYFQVVGDFAVCAGWQARAETLLEGAGETSERGWVALNAGMFEPDREVKHSRFREALAEARATGDVDLEVATLGYLGASLVHDDQVAEGMRLLDEALAALAGDEVDDFFVLEEVFCGSGRAVCGCARRSSGCDDVRRRRHRREASGSPSPTS